MFDTAHAHRIGPGSALPAKLMLGANSFRSFRPRPRQRGNDPYTWSLRVGYWRFPRRLIRKFRVFVLDMDDLGIFAALFAQKNLAIVLDTRAR